MFITFKLTARKVLAITAAVIIIVLGCNAVKTALTERGVYCENDAERVMWLKQYGIVADPSPLWSKETVISTDGADGWDEYCARLKEEGFDISDCAGKKVTVYCYRGKGSNEGLNIRVLSIGGRAIGFDVESTAQNT